MRLNTLAPAPGSKKPRLRVGRGLSAGQGKTCGRGIKGQRARKGGYHKVGFEGGQMPLQRRLPKRGFLATTIEKAAEVRSGDLAKVGAEAIDLAALKKARLVPNDAKRAKVILAGAVGGRFALTGIAASKGARAAIEQAGGSVAEPAAAEAAPGKKGGKAATPA